MGEAGMGGFGGGFGVTLAELRHDPECCLQVRSLTATISVEQRFLSPESAARMGDGANAARGGMQWLQGQVCSTGGGLGGVGVRGAALSPRVSLQVDAMVVAVVQQAVAVLRGCK